MPPAEGRQMFRFLRKPLLLFPCCGSNSHVSTPVSNNQVAPEELEAVNRAEKLRPSTLSVREEPLSKSEDPSDTHPYHCPICFYFFGGKFTAVPYRTHLRLS